MLSRTESHFSAPHGALSQVTTLQCAPQAIERQITEWKAHDDTAPEI